MAGNSNSGRRPLPTRLKIIKGTDQPSRANKHEPEVVVARREPPEHLTERARAHWDKVAPMLIEAKIMATLDVDTLAAYCEAFATWVGAKEHVEEHGSVVKGERGGFVMNPAMRVARQGYQDMVRIAAEFGMTPSSRSRLNTKATDATGGGTREADMDGVAADRLLG